MSALGRIRQLFGPRKRVETGAIRFGKDWPGYFIRGDNAAPMAAALRSIADNIEGTYMYEARYLIEFADELDTCVVIDKEVKRRMKRAKT